MTPAQKAEQYADSKIKSPFHGPIWKGINLAYIAGCTESQAEIERLKGEIKLLQIRIESIQDVRSGNF